MSDEILKPKVTVGCFAVNEAGKILLMRSPKWKNKLVMYGGHIEWGETVEQALRREVMEEVGIEVYDPQFLRPIEFVFSEEYKKDRHIVTLDYVVKTKAEENDVKLDGVEATEGLWLTPEEIIKRDDVEKTTKENVALYQKMQSDKGPDEYKIGWQRAVADYQNLQKETSTRRQEWIAMSKQQIIEDFIPVYDNFKKAFSHHPEVKDQKQVQNWIDGIGHIQRQFQEVLKSHGVEEIKTVGQKFDPRLHETVGEEEGSEPGLIVKEYEGGYTMGDLIIKVAKVIISK